MELLCFVNLLKNNNHQSWAQVNIQIFLVQLYQIYTNKKMDLQISLWHIDYIHEVDK